MSDVHSVHSRAISLVAASRLNEALCPSVGLLSVTLSCKVWKYAFKMPRGCDYACVGVGGGIVSSCITVMQSLLHFTLHSRLISRWCVKLRWKILPQAVSLLLRTDRCGLIEPPMNERSTIRSNGCRPPGPRSNSQTDRRDTLITYL